MTVSVSLGKRPYLHAAIRRVPALQSLEWLSRGWEDLSRIGAPSLAHGVLIAVLGAVLLMLAGTHLYLVAAAVSSYLLVGPIMTTGPCELSRRRAAGESTGFDESLQAFARNPESLMMLGAILAVIALLWLGTSTLMLQSLVHAPGLSLSGAMWGAFTDSVSRPQMISYIGSGAVLAAIVFSVSVVAVPLIIDRRANALDALWTSARATFWNLPAMLVWSAIIVALTAVGFATFLIGMIVVAPLLGHATWHAYKDLVGDSFTPH